MHHIISFDVGSQYTISNPAPLYISTSQVWDNQVKILGDDGNVAYVHISEFEAAQSDLSLDSIRQPREDAISKVGVGGATFNITTIGGKSALTWYIPRQSVLSGNEFEETYGYSYWYDNQTKIEVSVDGLGKTVYDNLLKMQIKEKS
jgi:hypothetical protein